MGELLHSWFIWFCGGMMILAVAIDWWEHRGRRKYHRKH